MDNKWLRARDQVREVVGDTNFEAWIRPLRYLGPKDGRVHLSAPSKFHRDWVARNYVGPIARCLGLPEEGVPPIVFDVDDRAQGELFEKPPPEQPRRAASGRGASRVGNLVPRYTFENFVVGPSNQFAHAAAKAVSVRPGEHYNPLFVYGWVGVGKTHLVNAIGHAVLKVNPNARIVYLSSETFVNDLIGSLRRDRMEDFKNRFRKVDLLILDDVQFLAGRERTQEEFFHTFNSLHEGHRQIILTSDKFPNQIPELEERLRNRFEWGLIADIQAPELETRVAILQKRAELEGLSLEDDVATFVATEITANARELEGAITRLGAFASLQRREITVEFAREVLQPHFAEQRRELSIEEIQRVVGEHFGLSLTELKSKRRTQRLALARQVAMFLCRKLVAESFPVIGSRFGGRDHSTVIHACSTIADRSRRDAGLLATLEQLERTLVEPRRDRSRSKVASSGS